MFIFYHVGVIENRRNYRSGAGLRYNTSLNNDILRVSLADFVGLNKSGGFEKRFLNELLIESVIYEQ